MNLSDAIKDRMPQSLLDKVSEYKEYIPEPIRQKVMLKVWSLLNVPLIHWVRPKIIEMNEDRTVFEIPLNWRTKNHLGSMYFGALAIGADATCGFLAISQLEKSGRPYSLVFKDLQANFLKRAEGDAIFTCNEGEKVGRLVQRALDSLQREEEKLKVVITCPDCLGETPVAEFTMTLSIKIRSDKH